jgi:hypothetical protein
MRPILLGLLLGAGVLHAQGRAQTPPPEGLQIQPPVFRGGVYLVPVGLALEYNGKPWTGLTSADFRVLLDKAELTPLDVTHDERAPSHYTLFLGPPDEARDGKTHVLQVKVKRPNSKNWTTLPFKNAITLPKHTTVRRQVHAVVG